MLVTSIFSFSHYVFKSPLSQVCSNSGLCGIQLKCNTRLKTHVVYWRGHQTFPTLVSLKGKLPEIMQSTSTFSGEIMMIHSLFRHGFIKKTEIRKTEIEKKRVLFLLIISIQRIVLNTTFIFKKI